MIDFCAVAQLASAAEYARANRYERVMPYANNKGADQPVHPCSLISILLFDALIV